ncbi:MAG: outer membrane beta-barrel protein [Saprospiraceae bacterium]|nr:outer membrane beta-barrel protein [Saprospiraceae bacterium]HRK81463.1 outer membrane beta-barrel protein [Saprospiraceae bacterium]
MQDKYTHHTSSSSPADLGWERMAALLDAEMPAQASAAPNSRKRRGLIWLWLLAGFIITAGAAATIYQHQRPAQEQLPEKPAVEALKPVMAQVERPTETVISASESTSVAEMKTVSPPSWATLTLSPAAQQHTMAATMQTASEYIESAASQTFTEAAPAVESTQVQQVALTAPSVKRWAGASPMLQSAVPAGLLNARPDLGLEPTIKTKRNARKKVRFGVELATGIAAGSGSVGNFSAGAVAIWKPGTMISARSGLLAGSNTGDLFMSTAARQSLVNDPNSGMLDNSTPLQALESRAFSGQTYRFQAVTLQLPAMLSYYLSPRLSVEGGVTAGLLLNLQNVVESSSEMDQLTNTGSSPTANFSQAQISSAVSNSVARWELLASAGLRCRLTPKFSVGLHYQHGLNDLLPDSSLQAMQRNVRLSGTMLF